MSGEPLSHAPEAPISEGEPGRDTARVMRIAYHVGLHCTDEDQLIRSLEQNTRWMRRRRGVVLARGNGYRRAIRDAIIELKGAEAPPEVEAMLLDEALGEHEGDRLLLSFDNFLCGPAKILGEGRLYPEGHERVAWLRRLFPSAECEFYFAIRDLASFLPAAWKLQKPPVSFAEFLGGADPLALRWSEMIARIREANPDVPLTVWCNEDTPLIWPTVLREYADVSPLDHMKGEFDVIEKIMRPEGFAKMCDYLEKHPPVSEVQRRRIMAAFLDKFAIDEELEEEIDIPGWTPELVETLSELYEEDVYAIERIPGVTLIGP
ncbi:hypothetical protein SAMN05216257_105236 [Meinhardsimonia xiamenensis]|jgi:hypothetical protein|uniref:Uncharacterized protein n=1 Tax=Meinhardsimonia xiamenensis TaxID=990712 RepID=A0A1G9FKK4_9RHOB|nr:hypothetical protein [Meinhardsimonia xiamenensis]PRX37799.1 hypothetical protein LV81_00067 [Meinhardsimonia xiamenensis]SDK88882.1 hypothetical protein SAMN05216257_105236 [Meinhardsimonia xiamenensis]